jgi:crotonobetainyl-CoA:carnitine CoA-transferase CaiB-like acyl-CoA transferase
VYQDHGQVAEHEQTAALNLIREIPESDHAIRVTAFPARFSRTTTTLKAGVPRIGQHTREIAAELGFEAAAVERLIAAGALVPEGESDNS